MLPIIYKRGDATYPTSKKTIIIHCCNNRNIWGAGFVLALSKRWPMVEDAYHKWATNISKTDNTTGDFVLGEVQFVKVEPNIIVANMIGQDGIGYNTITQKPPIRYYAIDSCLKCVNSYLNRVKTSVDDVWEVGGPKFGAGLAGGDWNKIVQLIINNLSINDVFVTIYLQ